MPVPSSRSFRIVCRSLFVLGVLVAGEGAGRAQNVTSATQSSPQATETADEKARREAELRQLEEALASSGESRRRLEAEIGELKGDAARLSAELIDTAERTRAAEERTQAVEQRLRTLTASETAIRRSLQARRGIIGEVLASLQRMGRRPPPAVLVRPEDMLAAVRTSILLGSVVPELRSEAETLAVDLTELVRIGDQIRLERETRAQELAALVAERERMSGLVAARQARLAEVERTAIDEG